MVVGLAAAEGLTGIQRALRVYIVLSVFLNRNFYIIVTIRDGIEDLRAYQGVAVLVPVSVDLELRPSVCIGSRRLDT